VDERDVLNAWRELFRVQPVSQQTLVDAEALLDGLSGESPLHLRLADELNDLKRAQAKPKKQPARRRSPT
jgi:hypothetical protein